jgi:uncharacterized membrane protein YphA (DoxX/SURF4 family)
MENIERSVPYTAAMITFAWVALVAVILFSLGGVIALAVPWRMRWVAVLGLALASAYWIAVALDWHSDTSVLGWIVFGGGQTLIALTLFCAGGWLGKVGRRALLAPRRR